MANPVSDFINLVQSMDEPRFSADTAQYANAVAAVLEASGDQTLLDRYRRSLTNATAWVVGEEGENSSRVAPIQTLLGAVEILQQATPRSRDLDVDALAAMVKGRAHADQVLRALVHRPLAPKDLLEALKLEPAQLHRVLRWASSVGLVERSGVARDVVYSISRLGETALRGTDEPSWVQTASLLLQLSIERRILGRSMDRTRHEATQLSGLTPAEAERTFAAFESALDPSVSSALASALGSAHSRAEVLLEPDVASQGRATALVSRALERAGIDDSDIEWWDSPEDADPRTFRDIALSRSVLCVRNPREGDLGAEVVAAFGSLVDFGRGVLHLRTRSSARRASWQCSGESDFGVVARFYSPTTGSSHFVVGGIGDEGTVAAARVFYERIESFLDARPDRSFAAVVHARAGMEAELIGDLHTLFTEDPYAREHVETEQEDLEPVMVGEKVLSKRAKALGRAATGVAALATAGALSWLLDQDRSGPRRIPAQRRLRSTTEDRDTNNRVTDIRDYHFPAGDEAYGLDLPLAARDRALRDDMSEPQISRESAWVDRG